MTAKEKQKSQIKEWALKHPQRMKELSRQSEERNKTHRVAYKAAYYLAHKERILQNTWVNKIKRKYGLTPEQYEKILKDQNHECGICNRKETCSREFKFRVDHCHKTGKVRGLLCHKCNAGIGMLGDTLKAIEKAVLYLRRTENG